MKMKLYLYVLSFLFLANTFFAAFYSQSVISQNGGSADMGKIEDNRYYLWLDGNFSECPGTVWYKVEKVESYAMISGYLGQASLLFLAISIGIYFVKKRKR